MKAAPLSRAFNDQGQKADIEELARRGMTVVTDVDRAAFTSAMSKVRDKFETLFGKDTLSAIERYKGLIMNMLLRVISHLSVRARIVIGFGTLVLLLASISLLYDMRLRMVRANVAELVAAANASETLAGFERDIAEVRRTATLYIGSPNAPEQVAALNAQKQAVKNMDKLKAVLSSQADAVAASLTEFQAAFGQLVAQNKEKQNAYGALGAANSAAQHLDGARG